MEIFSPSNIKFVLMLMVVLYIISHYSSGMCDLIGLEYKGTV